MQQYSWIWVPGCSMVSVSAPYLECLYLLFPMLVELPCVFPRACQGPVGGPGKNAVYDEVHTCPAWGEAWNLQIVLWDYFLNGWPSRMPVLLSCSPKASFFSSHLECWSVVWPKVLLCLLLNSVCSYWDLQDGEAFPSAAMCCLELLLSLWLPLDLLSFLLKTELEPSV